MQIYPLFLISITMASVQGLRDKEVEYAKQQGVHRERYAESFLHGGNGKVDESFMIPIGPDLFYTDPLCKESDDGSVTLLNVHATKKPSDVIYRAPCLLMYAVFQVEGKVMQTSPWIVEKLASTLFPRQSLRFTNLQAVQYYLQKKEAVDNSASFGQDKTLQICKDLAKEDKQRVAKREKPFLRPAEWNRFFDGLIKVRHRPLKNTLKAAIKLLEKTHEDQMNIGEIREFYSKKCTKYNK